MVIQKHTPNLLNRKKKHFISTDYLLHQSRRAIFLFLPHPDISYLVYTTPPQSKYTVRTRYFREKTRSPCQNFIGDYRSENFKYSYEHRMPNLIFERGEGCAKKIGEKKKSLSFGNSGGA